MSKSVIGYYYPLCFLLLFFVGTASAAQELPPSLPLNYVVYRAEKPLVLDGKMDEKCWQNAPWTEYFADIEGYHMPDPKYSTRAKILWDDNYLYIGVELEEPHIWATYTHDESVIFHENNIEVFIDPSGDTHNYYELEINALGTKWDLMLTKPYRYGGLPINMWEILGLKTGIYHAGTINNPMDVDTLWSIEIALPWEVLRETAPGKRKPVAGDQWRMNFSRVQWQLEIEEDKYVKKINPETGKPFPEYNWVWSPQGIIDMHLPEMWGYVQFSDFLAGKGIDLFVPDPDEKRKFALRRLFHLQHVYRRNNGRYAFSFDELKTNNDTLPELDFEPVIEGTPSRFMIIAPSHDGISEWRIIEDSRIWKTKR
jgi:hypothetical protein